MSLWLTHVQSLPRAYQNVNDKKPEKKKEEVMKKIGMKLMCGLSTALRCMYGLFLGLATCLVAFMIFVGTPYISSKAIAAELQQKNLKLPANFSVEDFKAALQLGWELRITKGEIPKCSEAYRPALQPAMEAARKCWNLNTCSKVVTDSARKAMDCPSLQKEEKHVPAGPNAGNIVKRLEKKGYSCSEKPAGSGNYTCIKVKPQKNVTGRDIF